MLCVDEATASVDDDTSKIVHATLQRDFKGCTVITVAHRLASIVDDDIVLVMDSGKIVEQGAPQELLLNPMSHFARLWASESARARDNKF